jgi:hypothetical protein
MSVNISILASNNAGNSVVGLIDIGTAKPSGYIEIRTGTKPAATEIAATGVILATCAMSNPAYGSFNNRIALANSISQDTNIANSGVAGWFRVYNRDGVAVFDGDVGLTGTNADLEFDNINFIKGGTAAITSLDAVMP